MHALIGSLFGLLLLWPANLMAAKAKDGMAHMPTLEPKRTYSVNSSAEGEALSESRGFGEKETEVGMMNLMMVEDSTKKTPRSSAKKSNSKHFSILRKDSSNRANVGSNLLEFSVINAQSGKPLSGLKIESEVSMAEMDMGVETPPVREVSPGNYQLKATFSMRGGWLVKLLLPEEEMETLSFTAAK